MVISIFSVSILFFMAVVMLGTALALKKRQQTLTRLSHAAEIELSRILDNIEDACFMMDNKCRIVFANARMYAISEWVPGSLVGVSCSDLFSPPVSSDFIGETIHTERTVEILREDGAYPRTMELKGIPLFDKANQRLGTFIKMSNPNRSRRVNAPSFQTLEQLWETLIAKQSTDLEQKNRELEQSGAELQQLVERIGSIKDQEGIRISRVLSGELSGLLADIRSNITNLQQTKDATIKKRVDSVLEVIDTAANQVETIIEGIRPSVLDGGHLGKAIEKIAAHFEKTHRITLKTRINVSATGLDIDLSTAVFRIAQESLTNIARHSGASEVQISLLDTSDGIALVVEDNGRGVSPASLESATALGVLGMKERAKSLGGRLSIENRETGGCAVSLFVPTQR